MVLVLAVPFEVFTLNLIFFICFNKFSIPGHLSSFQCLNFNFCWFDGRSIISTASNVVFWIFFCAKTCCIVCHAYCFCYGGTNMARKISEKPHSNRLLRWFNFSQSESRKNNRKAFEGASMEPTNLDSILVDIKLYTLVSRMLDHV